MYSEAEASRLVKQNTGSLEFLCKEAICTADLNLMLAMGFPEKASQRLCDAIKTEARMLGVGNLKLHFEDSVASNRSNLINLIVRKKHPLYFATRSSLHPISLLEHLEGPPSDICALLFQHAMGRVDGMRESRRACLLEREMRERVREGSLHIEGGSAGGAAEEIFHEERGLRDLVY